MPFKLLVILLLDDSAGSAMIVYDLKCRKDHVFEAWFPDSAAFDAQAGAGKIVCPVCGSRKVAKAPMAPRLAPRKNGEVATAGGAASAEAATVMRRLRDLRAQVEKNCDYVGDHFADEARKIHYREVGPRGIYGEASPQEANDLRDEGIEVGVIPWVPREDA